MHCRLDHDNCTTTLCRCAAIQVRLAEAKLVEHSMYRKSAGRQTQTPRGGDGPLWVSCGLCNASRWCACRTRASTWHFRATALEMALTVNSSRCRGDTLAVCFCSACCRGISTSMIKKSMWDSASGRIQPARPTRDSRNSRRRRQFTASCDLAAQPMQPQAASRSGGALSGRIRLISGQIRLSVRCVSRLGCQYLRLARCSHL